ARLVFGEHLREHPVQARLARDRFGRQTVVAREHRHAHAEPLERRDGARRVGLQHVGGGEHAEEPAGERQVDDRFAVGGELPDAAPRPAATMIAVGVASPIAQGHAITRTATALVSARRPAGSGPRSHHETNVSAAITRTTGTKTPATRSASRWIGAREPWA